MLSDIAKQLSSGPAPEAREQWPLPGRSQQTPRQARTGVIEACRRWGLPGDAADDLALIVSELATNAVVHAPGKTVFVSLVLTSSAAHVVVIDEGRGESPCEEPPVPAGEGGRGLMLVQSVASRFVMTTTATGTTACASVALAGTGAEDGWNTELDALVDSMQASLAP
ncbi:ATP-binding protein [Streptomyces chartreusis]|uniref:ATP-binding protein n=1 Tax=Streptomyces chartreusis TaxID=1969 RepID=UPI003646626F